jgi:acetyl-CoA carboxylase biotin carboxyl carrier protein
MNLKELKEIIDIVTSKESIEELEIEQGGVRIRIKRSSGSVVHTLVPGPVAVAPPVSLVSALPPAAQSPANDDLFYIKSPIVGTFYKSPTPTSEAFVSVGAMVEKGSVLCIIEAMKLMNEIESEVAGEITAVLVENGQPVEYGEKLFAIRPR